MNIVNIGFFVGVVSFVIILLLLISGCVIFRAKNNKVYCYIFEHRDWNLWEKIYKHIDGAMPVEHNNFEANPELENCVFYEYIGDKKYAIVLWVKRGEVAVYDTDFEHGKVLLCGFDEYHEKKVAKKLYSKALFYGMIEQIPAKQEGETMKEIKDRFVPANAWYFVCGYLNDTRYEPIFRRHLERYSDDSKNMYGNPTPMYKMAWMDFDLFKEILREAGEYYASKAEVMTDENIEKYLEH